MMESELKSLKVADLKGVLKYASVSLPPKPTKADLVTKILAEPAAVDAYHALYNPTGVSPQQKTPSKPKPAAKPEVSAIPPTNPPISPKQAQDPAPLLKPTSITSKTKPAAATSTEDAELEKRKARAARFGIPLVESKRPASTTETSEKQLPDDQAKLKERAERFGTETNSDSSNGRPRRKRGAPEEPVDSEELERRKKRAERFGVPLAGTSKT